MHFECTDWTVILWSSEFESQFERFPQKSVMPVSHCKRERRMSSSEAGGVPATSLFFLHC